MKATRPQEHQRDELITIRSGDEAHHGRLVVIVPESGAHVDAVERALIAFALARTEGNRTHAARFLGLSRSALIYRMHKHGLVGPDRASHSPSQRQ